MGQERRFFTEEDVRASGERITLSSRDSHHVRDVLRLELGAELVVVSKISGESFSARIAELHSKGLHSKGLHSKGLDFEARVVVETTTKAVQATRTGDAKCAHLIVGLPKSDLPEWIVEKATELGVDSIAFFAADRSVVKLKSGPDALKKQRRLEATAEAAAKQSKRTLIPKVTIIESLETALFSLPESSVVFACSLAATATPLKSCAAPESRDYALVVGPEGDFSPNELAVLDRGGARQLSLGNNTLRVETAAICALAQTNLLWQP
jgi:16S rRNA (uracil1498-N3)-methyltransferase